MEEIEDPTERAQEEIHHHAHAARERWILGVALSSAVIAGLAAVCALLGGHHANEMLIDRVEATNQWAYYQAKGQEKLMLEIQAESAILAGVTSPSAEQKAILDRRAAKMKEYDQKRDEAKKRAEEKTADSVIHAARHHSLAYGVTMFQIAIAVGAISVLTKRPPFWFVSLGFAGVGIFFLTQGLFFVSGAIHG